MSKIKIIPIKNLKPHELTNQKRFLKVKKMIKKLEYFSEPIIVEGKHFIILDGHHRTRVLGELGYKKVPAIIINYNDPKIKVFARRKNLPIDKRLIVNYVLSGRIFPCKTSRHVIPDRPKNLNIKLDQLL